ncbi:MAG: hypothetical protein AAGG59_11030 [Bacteroidota bacterium]
MVWVVVDENPWPDTYMPVYVRPETKIRDKQNKNLAVSVFTDEATAVKLARKLQAKYKAKTVRMFYSQGFSKTV